LTAISERLWKQKRQKAQKRQKGPDLPTFLLFLRFLSFLLPIVLRIGGSMIALRCE
jgi:hypothetical protein